MESVVRGATVQVTCTFKTAGGEVIEPTSVTAELLSPAELALADPVPAATTPLKVEKGVWMIEWVAEEPALWRFRFDGVGPNIPVEGSVYVNDSPFA